MNNKENKIIERVGEFRKILSPSPSNGDPAQGRIGNVIKCSRSEVEIMHLACCTTIGDRDSRALPVSRGNDLLVANRIVIGIASIETRECVK